MFALCAIRGFEYMTRIAASSLVTLVSMAGMQQIPHAPFFKCQHRVSYSTLLLVI